jgi:hypothetical protein
MAGEIFISRTDRELEKDAKHSQKQMVCEYLITYLTARGMGGGGERLA